MSENNTSGAPPMRILIAEEVRALLGRRKMSGAELARKMGVTQPWISRRLTGDIAFDVDELAKVAALLSVHITDLLPRKEEGRLITAVAARAESGSGSNAYSNSVPERAGRVGYASRTAPPESSRRPGRISTGTRP